MLVPHQGNHQEGSTLEIQHPVIEDGLSGFALLVRKELDGFLRPWLIVGPLAENEDLVHSLEDEIE